MNDRKAAEITHEDWQIFSSKLINSLPGGTSGAKHKWLQDKTGISMSTSQNWTSRAEGKAGGIPSTENLFKIAGLLEISLSHLIVIIQERLDPPAPPSGQINQSVIVALAEINKAELGMTAQGLDGITSPQLAAAASNLLQMIEYL
jgi:hypothetical protein